MDIGNVGHILMDAHLAKSLIPLKEEYDKIIKPIGQYRIKQGIGIDLFSVFSKDFGNPGFPMIDNVIS